VHRLTRVVRTVVGIGTVFLLLGPQPVGAQQSSGSKASSSTQASSAKAPSKAAVAKPAPKKKTTSSVARSRAAAAARARRAAAARQQQEIMTPRFKRDLVGNLVPDVRAAAAIVFDPTTGEVLWEENSNDQRSIASLTKVMTALVFLADEPDLTQRVPVVGADLRKASVTYLRAGERVSYDDLLHLMLIASDNGAARVLARTSEGGTRAFVARMNDMAHHLNLSATHYTDPSGLDSTNVSSAYDVSQLIAFAAGESLLADIMRTEEYEAHTSARPISIHSTNKLLGSGVEVRAGKTGFIRKAGYCLATLLQMPQGSQVAVVVLGAANSTTRFWEARHLFNWVVDRPQALVVGENQN